jgi:hypothetical protein
MDRGGEQLAPLGFTSPPAMLEAPVKDVLRDPHATWVRDRARRTRACLLSTAVTLGTTFAAFGIAFGSYLFASLAS